MRGAGLSLALLLVLVSCGSSGETVTPEATGAGDAVRAQAAVLGLCEIRDASELETAEAVFHDRSHDALHAIAAAVEEVDRGAAADLLAAKQRVEADLAARELPATFASDVEDLLAATRAALAALGVPVPLCPA